MAVVAAGAIVACSSHQKLAYTVVAPPRDFAAYPAVATIDHASTIYALSDVHGGYDRMVTLLAAAGVMASGPATPDAATWTAHDAVLVVTGDLFDKGPQALEALDLLRALEPQAAAAGGRVIFTLGNHEAEFLDDPGNDKASKDDGVNAELASRHLPATDVASGKDPRGLWLRQRPLGARVGGWFFSHAGDTHGRTVADLESALRADLLAHDYHGDETVGGSSILESRGWYDADPGTAAKNAAALSVKHIVFGHQPDALGARGEIAVGANGVLFRIDCGLSPDVNDSTGHVLRIHSEPGPGGAAVDVAESVAPDGSAHELWRGP